MFGYIIQSLLPGHYYYIYMPKPAPNELLAYYKMYEKNPPLETRIPLETLRVV